MIRLRALVASLLALPLLAAAPAALAQRTMLPATIPPPAGTGIQADTSVRFGQLPNGLRYAVKRLPSPEDRVAIRFHVKVGAFDEQDSERGAAHFIEHMAFNGTRNFGEATLVRTFEAAGLAFGKDQNAATTLWGTSYSLDLAIGDAPRMDLSFKWLRDVADGVSFDTAGVGRERGVILAENNRSLGPQRDLAIAQQRFFGPGFRSPDRLPIGTVERIQNITAEQLRGFYSRWYRPDNALIVVVGDLDEAATIARIEETFGSWRASGPAPRRADLGRIDLKRGLDVLTRQQANLPTTVTLCRVGAPQEANLPETTELYRWIAPHWMWDALASDRLGRLSRAADSPFLQAGAERDNSREALTSCFLAAANGTDWKSALRGLELERRRLDAHGFTEAEFRRALAGRRAALDQAVAREETRNSVVIADSILANYVDDEIWKTAAEDRRLFELGAEGLTAAKVTDAFRTDFEGAGPLVSVISAEPVAPEAVRAAWAEIAEQPTPPPLEATAARDWPYASFGPPGQVVRREQVAAPGFTRLEFANGLRVNFKEARYTRDRIDVRIRFGAGQREFAPSTRATALLAPSLFSQGGLGRLSADELDDVNAGKDVGARLSFDREAFVLSGDTQGADFEREMQLLAATLTDPGFRREIDGKVAGTVNAVYPLFRINPSAVLQYRLFDYIAPDGSQSLPPAAELAAVRSTDVAALLRPALSQAGLEVTIVGDIDEARMIEVVSATLGALPPRRFTDRARPDVPPLRYPAGPAPLLTGTHEGAAEQGAAAVVFPTFVQTAANLREARALTLAADVLDEQVRERLREALGKTYSPEVNASFPNNYDQGAVTVAVTGAPSDLDELTREVKVAAGRMAAGGFDADDLLRVRRPIVDAAVRQRQSNQWWLRTLDGSWRNPDQLTEAETLRDDVAGITLDEVKAAAAKWLRPETAVVVEARPAAGR